MSTPYPRFPLACLPALVLSLAIISCGGGGGAAASGGTGADAGGSAGSGSGSGAGAGGDPAAAVYTGGELTVSTGNGTTSNITMTTDGSYRYLSANGIPNHVTGAFPNAGNPNAISAQNYHVKFSAWPQVTGILTWLTTPFSSESGISRAGWALNGVPLDVTTAEFWNNELGGTWNYEAITGGINLGIDTSNAHVQPTGAYHYHALPTGLVAVLGKGTAMTLVGWAADGFPVYARWGHQDPLDASSAVVEMSGSYRVKSGSRPGGPGGSYDGTFTRDWEYVANLGTLDECNGRFGVTPEFPQGIYHYYITTSYPFIQRCVKGTVVDPSFFPL
ncbi:MAG TPA: YHYH protein [Moraxellaceae bacterium]|nr:YHYH protein [Moraxellaceae bacterium]